MSLRTPDTEWERDATVRLSIGDSADPADVPGLPWELLPEPRTDQPAVLGAAEFVRTHRRIARVGPGAADTAAPTEELIRQLEDAVTSTTPSS